MRFVWKHRQPSSASAARPSPSRAARSRLPGTMPDFWPRRAAWVSVALAAAASAGCGPKHVKPTNTAAPPPTTLIALLPDPESGVTGRARVNNEFGAANLAAPRAATSVKADGPPGAVTPLSEDDVT